MQKWMLFFVIFLLSCGGIEISRSCALNGEGCPADGNTRTIVKGGSSCSTSESDTKVVISCTDGTRSTIYKPKSGTNGKDGDSVVGPQGAPGVDGDTGKDGDSIVGPKGDTGESGTDGYSTVFLIVDSLTCPAGGKMILLATDTNRNGMLDLTGDSGLQSADICNGTDGTDGVDGTDGTNAPVSQFSVVSVIDPCGDKQGATDEVMLKLGNGSILASFSDNANGKNTRFSLLTPGSYVTTDGSICFFTVNSNMDITNEHY